MHCTDGTVIQAGRHWSGVYGTARCMPVRSEEISEPSFQKNKKKVNVMKTSVMVLTSSRATHLVEHQWILFGKEFLDDKGHTLERHMTFWGLWRGGRRGKGKGRRRKKKKYKRGKVALWAGNVWVKESASQCNGQKTQVSSYASAPIPPKILEDLHMHRGCKQFASGG